MDWKPITSVPAEYRWDRKTILLYIEGGRMVTGHWGDSGWYSWGHGVKPTLWADIDPPDQIDPLHGKSG